MNIQYNWTTIVETKELENWMIEALSAEGSTYIVFPEELTNE